MKKRNTKKCKPILSKAEINHFKKEFFYEEIQEGNKIKVPLSIIKKNNYQGEPFLVSMQEKWKRSIKKECPTQETSLSKP